MNKAISIEINNETVKAHEGIGGRFWKGSLPPFVIVAKTAEDLAEVAEAFNLITEPDHNAEVLVIADPRQK